MVLAIVIQNLDTCCTCSFITYHLRPVSWKIAWNAPVYKHQKSVTNPFYQLVSVLLTLTLSFKQLPTLYLHDIFCSTRSIWFLESPILWNCYCFTCYWGSGIMSGMPSGIFGYQMQRNLHIIWYKLGYHRIQFGHQCFLTYMFTNYHYKLIIIFLSFIVMTQYYWGLFHWGRHVNWLRRRLILIWMLLFVGVILNLSLPNWVLNWNKITSII